MGNKLGTVMITSSKHIYNYVCVCEGGGGGGNRYLIFNTQSTMNCRIRAMGEEGRGAGEGWWGGWGGVVVGHTGMTHVLLCGSN